MDLKSLKKEIRRKEISLQILSIRTSLERFELEALKSQAELERLNEESAKSKAALQEKELELELLLKE